MPNGKPTYFKTIKEVEETFETDINKGISYEIAKQRHEKFGANQLEQKSKISIWKVFFDQFKSIVMLLLMIAAIASFLIGEQIEAIAVLVVIIITAVLGLIMEYRAGKSIEALQKKVNEKAKIIRDGEVITLSADKLVPGDIVIIEEGDQIPADGRIVESEELSIDESMLTGESEPVLKHIEALKEDSKISQRKNMVYMGTSVLSGRGKFIISAIANDAEIGKISEMLQQTKTQKTPLEKRLEQTGRYLISITIIITGVVAFIGYISGEPLEEMLKTSIALAIAAVPEGLPVTATITLAIGMKRMVQKKALMRNLPAVETLGSATVFCTDKTGTLTENEMTLQKIIMDNRNILVSGTGYRPDGRFKEDEKELDPTKDEKLSLILKAGLLCSDATLSQNEDQKWEVIGDPTEGALIIAAKKAGLKKKDFEKEYARINEIPFDSKRMMMAVLYEDNDNKREVYLKGAPEEVIEICDCISEDDSENKFTKDKQKQYQEKNEQLAKDSYRVLAIAYKKQVETKDLENEIQEGMVFLGLVGMIDPPREDVKESIKIATEAGIRTIMLTGDQYETAIGIANSIGIEIIEDQSQSNKDVSELSVEELEQMIHNQSIYARVTPKDKLNIVEVLKKQNEVVAMTGDGVNDAPALKKADIGVAMGIRGTTVAKEASDMILLDDRFSTIVEAVRQGRVIFDNIQKFIHYLLSCNLSEILFIFLSIIVGVPVPLVALQILWLNVVTGVFPALAMAWELPEEGVMQNKPRNPKSSIITKRYKYLIVIQGFIIALGPLLAYVISLNQGFAVETARTIGFMTLAIVHLLQVFNVRRKNGLGIDKTFFKNPYLFVSIILTFTLQIIAVYATPLQRILRTTSLSFEMWGYVVIGALLPSLVLQLSSIVKNKMKGEI